MKRVLGKLRYLAWRIGEEFHPEKHPYDILSGCDTSGMIHRRRLGSEATDYQAIDPDVFHATIAHICEDFSQFTFVDLGCGKGRALLLAEEYPFKNIIGVEFAKDLAIIASKNAARVGSSRISVVNRDARQFDLPPGPLLIFMYNPFSADILRKVIQRLLCHTKPFYLAYVNPLNADVLSSTGVGDIVASDHWCTIWRFSAGNQAEPRQPKAPSEVCGSNFLR